jgi:hypothetical protein
MTSDALIRLIRINIRQKEIIRVRQQVLQQHRMQMNRIQALEDKLAIERDIAFRELAFSMKKEEKEYNKVTLEDMFPESGPLSLTDGEFYSWVELQTDHSNTGTSEI